MTDHATITGWTKDIRRNFQLRANTKFSKINFKYAISLDVRSAWTHPGAVAYQGILWALYTGRLSAEITLYLREFSAWKMCALIAEVQFYSEDVTQGAAYEYLQHSSKLAKAAHAWCVKTDEKARAFARRINGLD